MHTPHSPEMLNLPRLEALQAKLYARYWRATSHSLRALHLEAPLRRTMAVLSEESCELIRHLMEDYEVMKGLFLAQKQIATALFSLSAQQPDTGNGIARPKGGFLSQLLKEGIELMTEVFFDLAAFEEKLSEIHGTITEEDPAMVARVEHLEEAVRKIGTALNELAAKFTAPTTPAAPTDTTTGGTAGDTITGGTGLDTTAGDTQEGAAAGG